MKTSKIIEFSSLIVLGSFAPPYAMAQYTVVPATTATTAQPTSTSTTTTTSSATASMGQPSPLLGPPTLPALNGYLTIGNFISGNSFPSSQSGPIYMLYISSPLDPLTAVTSCQSLLSSNGWTVNSSQTSSGSVTGTLGSQTCAITIKKAFGRDKSRIYFNYQTNTTPVTTTTTTTSPTAPAVTPTATPVIPTQ